QRFEHHESSLSWQLTPSGPSDSAVTTPPDGQFPPLLRQPVGWGRPQQPLGLKESWSLEDVFTIVYTLVGDAYQKLCRNPPYFSRRPHAKPVFSGSEVLALALVAELNGDDSRLSWWGYVHKNYLHLFPRLSATGRAMGDAWPGCAWRWSRCGAICSFCST